MPTTYVEVSPFVKPCPEDEKRYIDCEDGVVVQDFVTCLGELLSVDPKTLKAVKPTSDGFNVLLGPKEPLPPVVKLKGCRSFSGVPSTVLVKGQTYRSSLTKSEALAVQKDTMTFYEDPIIQAGLKKLQKEIIDDLNKGKQIKGNTYTSGLRPIIQPAQDKLLQKWGFEEGMRGFVNMQSIFNNTFGTDPDVQENVNKINTLIGTDFSFMPAEWSAAVAPNPQTGRMESKAAEASESHE